MLNDMAWHCLEIKEVMRKLGSSRSGLSENEARERLKRYGLNKLKELRKISPMKIFLEQFKSFLVVILIIATVISSFLGEIIDTVVILAIVFASALLGFIQEFKAEKALEKLKEMVSPTAKVVRGGKLEVIPAEEVVPGDVIVLEAGDKVPADGRLIFSWNLQVDEASLTGESVPVEKITSKVPENASLTERRNMVYMGTCVTYGRGEAVVTGTGMKTEFGKNSGMLQEIEKETTPLQKKLDKVGKNIGLLCLIVCGVVASLGLVRGGSVLGMLLWGISLAVAAVPEALPAVVTITLAVGVQRMARRNAVIRRLSSVETLGSSTVICTDKTGTLTKNEMTVKEIYLPEAWLEVRGTGYEPRGTFKVKGEKKEINPSSYPDLILLLKAAVLCNNSYLEEKNGKWIIRGDPTEGALLTAAAKAKLSKNELESRYPRVFELPFDSMRKMMTTIHEVAPGKFVAYVKGAPEVIVKASSYYRCKQKNKLFTEEMKREVLEINREMAKNGLRVLAIAYREVLWEKEKIFKKEEMGEIEENLIFLGLTAMMDPPREEVKEAVEKCRKAGIKVVMITGDHELTAVSVAKQIGLIQSPYLSLTGEKLDSMSDRELEELVEKVSIYARVSPQHKMRIVKALKKKKHVVAVTGDGVNDAPALKTADIGVSMGITGTDVAKEASDMIISDDNFASIVAAIEEGRGIYDNIKKYLMYLLACNIGEILIMLFGGLIGVPLPLLAMQILMINLTTDGLPAIALSVDPYDRDVMERPPRNPEESIFTPRMKAIIGLGAILMGVLGIGTFLCFLQRGVLYARSTLFWFVTLYEMFKVFPCRSERHTSIELGFRSNRPLIAAIISSLSLTLLILFVSVLQQAFKVTAVNPLDLLLLSLLATLGIIVIDTGKELANRGILK